MMESQIEFAPIPGSETTYGFGLAKTGERCPADSAITRASGLTLPWSQKCRHRISSRLVIYSARFVVIRLPALMMIGLLDTVWMLLVAMTTVGYGDLYPVSFLGRAAVFVVAVTGIVGMGVLQFLTDGGMAMLGSEQRVIAYYETRESEQFRKSASASFITTWYRYYNYKEKRFPSSEREEFEFVGNKSEFRSGKRENRFRLSRRRKFFALKIEMCLRLVSWKALRNRVDNSAFDFRLEEISNKVKDMKKTIDIIMEQPNDSEKKEALLNERIILSSYAMTPAYGETRETSLASYDLSLDDETSQSSKSQLIHFIPDTQFQNPTNMQSPSQFPDVLLHYIRTNGRLSDALTQIISDPDVRHISAKDRNIVLALKLLKLQHKILGDAIDTMYTMTKREIATMKRTIISLSENYRRNELNSDTGNALQQETRQKKISFSSTSSLHFYDESIGCLVPFVPPLPFQSSQSSPTHPPAPPPPYPYPSPPPPPPPSSPTNTEGIGEILSGCTFTNVGNVTINITRY